MTFSTRKPASPLLRGIGIVALIGSLAMIFSTGSNPVSPETVEASLKRFGDYVATDAAKSGKEGRFSYGEIEARGFLMNRFAMVHDVTLEIKKQTLLESVSWSLFTPQMAVVPDAIMAHRLYYVFGEPVTVRKNGQSAATIAFSEPLKYGQSESHGKKATFLNQVFKLPPSITITPAAPEGAGSVVIAYDKNPTVEITSAPEIGLRKSKYDFRHINVTAGTQKPLSIGAYTTELNEKKDEKGVVQGQYTMAMTDLQTEATPKPCNVNIDIAYVGDQPLLKLVGYVSSTPDTSATVKTLALDCADFKITAEGTLGRAPEDPLPSGQLNVKLQNVKELMASQLLGQQGREMLSQVLVKITGQPVDTLTNAEIPLKRDKNGTFYIGDVTFEQLAASLFSNMIGTSPLMPGKTTEPVPTAAEKPVDPQLPDPETHLLDTSDKANKAEKPIDENTDEKPLD